MPSLPLADFFSELSGALGQMGSFITSGGIFMICLLVLSLLSVSVIVFKALTLRVEQVAPVKVQEAMEQADEYAAAGELNQLQGVFRAEPSPLSRIGQRALSADRSQREEAAVTVEANAREEVVKLESGIALLEVVITIAPLLGLLGTVSGLVGVFSNLDAGASPGSHAAVARGIAEALNTTIAGLAVAVPTVIAHSYFTKKLERLGVRMEVLTGGLLSAVFRGEGGPAPAVPGAAPEPAPRPFTEPQAPAPRRVQQ